MSVSSLISLVSAIPTVLRSQRIAPTDSAQVRQFGPWNLSFASLAPYILDPSFIIWFLCLFNLLAFIGGRLVPPRRKIPRIFNTIADITNPVDCMIIVVNLAFLYHGIPAYHRATYSFGGQDAMCRAHGIESVMAEYGYYHYLAKLLEFYGLLTLLVKGRRPSLFFHAYLTSSVLAAYATLAYDVPQMFVHLVVSAVDTVLQYTLLLFCWFEYEIPAVSRAAEVSQVVFPVVAAAWGAWWVLMADDKCASDAQRSIGLFVYLANLPALALQVHRIKRGTRKLRAHKGYSTYYSKE